MKSPCSRGLSERTHTATVVTATGSATHFQGQDVCIGAVLVDLIHCALQGHGLLSQVFQVLGALFGLLVMLAKLRSLQKVG